MVKNQDAKEAGREKRRCRGAENAISGGRVMWGGRGKKPVFGESEVGEGSKGHKKLGVQCREKKHPDKRGGKGRYKGGGVQRGGFKD